MIAAAARTWRIVIRGELPAKSILRRTQNNQAVTRIEMDRESWVGSKNQVSICEIFDHSKGAPRTDRKASMERRLIAKMESLNARGDRLGFGRLGAEGKRGGAESSITSILVSGLEKETDTRHAKLFRWVRFRPRVITQSQNFAKNRIRSEKVRRSLLRSALRFR